MPKVIITPWREEAELLEVRHKFYPLSAPNAPFSTDQRDEACRIVEAWKLRGHLPHAVEATALLTDAILHDDSTRNSVFSIRATYAAAFSRFVTGLVDTKLGSGGGAGGTMFNRASAIGLPLSFVELRHEAAHRELPSLVLLRSYTNRALEWLWEYYWVIIDQNAPFPAKAGEAELKGSIQSMLLQFRQQVQSDSSRKRVKSAAMAVSQSVVAICKSDLQGAKLVCRVILEDGFIVPDNKQPESSMEAVFLTWDPILQSINDSFKAFSTILTEEMAKELSDRPDSPATTQDRYLEGVFAWLEHILASESWNQDSKFLCSTAYLRFICDEWSNHWTRMLATILEQHPVIIQISDSLSNQSVISENDHVDPALVQLQASGWLY